MAGSLKFFEYTTDDDEVFAIFADESNVEAANGTGVDYTGTSTATYWLPRNVEPRYAVYSSADGTRNIKIPIMTTAIFSALLSTTPTITDPIAGTGTLTLSRLVPQIVKRLPKSADTGLIDGDAT